MSARFRIGVMKSKFAKEVPSFRKLCKYVSDSCLASSAADMWQTASGWGNVESAVVPSSDATGETTRNTVNFSGKKAKAAHSKQVISCAL